VMNPMLETANGLCKISAAELGRAIGGDGLRLLSLCGLGENRGSSVRNCGFVLK
jgi:hypothetical protein